jgi:NAD(P)-dependent dehydrogenase (short-subunit alcohol dehydrogenase family)
LTEPQAAAGLAPAARDLTIVVNNAGIVTFGPLLEGDDADVQHVFALVTLGPLRVAKAFAPVLVASGAGALINMHSVTAWIAGTGTYGAAKAALIAITNTLRLALAPRGTQVLGIQVVPHRHPLDQAPGRAEE